MLGLLSIGEAMAEIRSDAVGSGFAVGFAGDTFNTAVYARRALQALSDAQNAVGYMTRIGRDPLSSGFLEQAEAEGLDIAAVERDIGRTIGIYTVATDAQGERSFHYWRNQSAARGLFDVQVSLPPARVLYLSGITMAIISAAARERLIEALKNAQAAGAKLAYDSNFRPQLWEDRATAQHVTERLWEIADLAFPSLDDEMALFNESSEEAVLERFAAGGFERCALKRGERGPLAPTCEGPLPAFSVAPSVIDTTAAGDSFNGGYLAAYLTGADEPACLSAGHGLASAVVGVRGAIAPVGMIAL